MLPKGKWQHSRIFEEIGVAVEQLGIVPSEFWAKPKTDQALVIAYFRVKSTISAYEDHINKPKPSKKGK